MPLWVWSRGGLEGAGPPDKIMAECIKLVSFTKSMKSESQEDNSLADFQLTNTRLGEIIGSGTFSAVYEVEVEFLGNQKILCSLCWKTMIIQWLSNTIFVMQKIKGVLSECLLHVHAWPNETKRMTGQSIHCLINQRWLDG